MITRTRAGGSKLEATVIEGMSSSPLSAALTSGGLIFTSGQTGRDAATGTVPATFHEQVNIALRNLDTVLQAAGGSRGSVAKTTVYMVSANDFAPMNSIYATHFEAPYPARSTVIVAALASPELKFEIEAIAVREEKQA